MTVSRSRSGSRSRSPSAYRQQIANRPHLLIFCEGSKTESAYLTNWHRVNRDKVIIRIAHHEYTTPFELTQAAAHRRRADLRNGRRGRGAAFDQYWCMFDVDEHPKIHEALELAHANDIGVALSSPCLELWFLIHFENQTAYIDRSEAQRRSRDIIGCDKVLTAAALGRLVEEYDQARKRAQALEIKHKGDGSSKPWNPYADVWKLIDVINSGSINRCDATESNALRTSATVV